MEIQQSLVEVLLQLKSALHSSQSIVPLIALRFLKRPDQSNEQVTQAYGNFITLCSKHLYVLKQDAPPPLVLELHELLSMLVLLLAVLLEELSKTRKGNIIPFEVVSLLVTKSSLGLNTITHTQVQIRSTEKWPRISTSSYYKHWCPIKCPINRDEQK